MRLFSTILLCFVADVQRQEGVKVSGGLDGKYTRATDHGINI